MKKKVQQLKGLISLRRSEKLKHLQQYSTALKNYQVATGDLQGLRNNLTKEWRQNADRLANGTQAYEIQETQERWHYIEEQISSKEAAIISAQQELQRKSDLLAKSMQRHKSVENYREKLIEQAQQASDKEDQNQLDELACLTKSIESFS